MQAWRGHAGKWQTVCKGEGGSMKDLFVGQLPPVGNKRNNCKKETPVSAQFCQDLPGLEQASKVL